MTFVNHLALHGIFLLKVFVFEIIEAASVPAVFYGAGSADFTSVSARRISLNELILL